LARHIIRISEYSVRQDREIVKSLDLMLEAD